MPGSSFLRFATPALTLSLAAATLDVPLTAQKPNYDESKVPSFELPRLLLSAGGKPIADAKQWQTVRRPAILALFERSMYGRVPGREARVEFEVVESGPAFDGIATRKQVELRCRVGKRSHTLHLLVYLPARPRTQANPSRSKPGPVPVFLGLNFNGNHSIAHDPAIRLSTAWMRNRKGSGNENNRATDKARGKAARRWPVAKLVAKGCALATMYYGDIDPDFDDDFRNGVHGLFGEKVGPRSNDAWGSIAAWAWGLSRALDYIESDAGLDGERTIVVGHSRLGKTSLWAGAADPRFAMVVSNNSGCGGAALSRRRFGETVARINKVFPHWFCREFHRFGGKEDELPIDQHMLIALIAPRPVLVCSATQDRWADPRGEFLAVRDAGPVYELFGHAAVAASPEPDGHAGLATRAGYFLRTGKHDMTSRDWDAYVAFAKRHGVLDRR